MARNDNAAAELCAQALGYADDVAATVGDRERCGVLVDGAEELLGWSLDRVSIAEASAMLRYRGVRH